MSIKRSERFPLLMTPGERRLLEEIAEAERLTAAEVLRGLLRDAAKDADLWPPSDPEPESEQLKAKL